MLLSFYDVVHILLSHGSPAASLTVSAVSVEEEVEGKQLASIIDRILNRISTYPMYSLWLQLSICTAGLIFPHAIARIYKKKKKERKEKREMLLQFALTIESLLRGQ